MEYHEKSLVIGDLNLLHDSWRIWQRHQQLEEHYSWHTCKKQWTSIYFILFYLFIFISFSIILYFSIFRTLGLGLKVTGHTVTSVTFDGVVTTVIIELERKKQKVLEQSNIIQHGHHILISCFIYGHLGQDIQYLAQTICRSI